MSKELGVWGLHGPGWTRPPMVGVSVTSLLSLPEYMQSHSPTFPHILDGPWCNPWLAAMSHHIPSFLVYLLLFSCISHLLSLSFSQSHQPPPDAVDISCLISSGSKMHRFMFARAKPLHLVPCPPSPMLLLEALAVDPMLVPSADFLASGSSGPSLTPKAVH